MSASSTCSRPSTRVPGLDDILLGGLPKNHDYLARGGPGTGGTSLATHFVLDRNRRDKRCLYMALSESKAELESGARPHGRSLNEIPISEVAPAGASLSSENRYSVSRTGEVELATTAQKLTAGIDRVNPARPVLESPAELRLLVQEAVRMRTQFLAIRQFSATRTQHYSIEQLKSMSRWCPSDCQT